MTGRVSRALASLLALLVLLTACGGGEPAASDAGLDTDGLHGSALDEPYQVPETELVDTAGADYSLTDADADLTLVFFGYTHCPDICGIVMSTIASALVRLDDADRERVDVVFVTTDPARDDPASLRAYLDSYDPEFEGATGEMETIIATARELAVFVEQGEKLPGGGYEVVHSDPIIGLDDQDQATTVWSKDTSAQQLAEDIEELLSR
ncbi:SCO family protein [Nocardioides campestrisoli]|uniref:SCO family protein n=1 Tax=Nocardioides campestrisoli TaxID=2736757 RepID=UPI0015E7310E|nr:SCO family protein [Nocardioides campestrisoli]